MGKPIKSDVRGDPRLCSANVPYINPQDQWETGAGKKGEGGETFALHWGRGTKRAQGGIGVGLGEAIIGETAMKVTRKGGLGKMAGRGRISNMGQTRPKTRFLRVERGERGGGGLTSKEKEEMGLGIFRTQRSQNRKSNLHKRKGKFKVENKEDSRRVL